MLVLTRKLQEQIKIGDDVVITILQIRGKAVRIGIQAPRTMRILRAELPELDPAEAQHEMAAAKSKVEAPEAPQSARHINAGRAPLASRLLARRDSSVSLALVPTM
jgi:carbon storage regulator CsrA